VLACACICGMLAEPAGLDACSERLSLCGCCPLVPPAPGSLASSAPYVSCPPCWLFSLCERRVRRVCDAYGKRQFVCDIDSSRARSHRCTTCMRTRSSLERQLCEWRRRRSLRCTSRHLAPPMASMPKLTSMVRHIHRNKPRAQSTCIRMHHTTCVHVHVRRQRFVNRYQRWHSS
jgi:hypothetical protein